MKTTLRTLLILAIVIFGYGTTNANGGIIITSRDTPMENPCVEPGEPKLETIITNVTGIIITNLTGIIITTAVDPGDVDCGIIITN